MGNISARLEKLERELNPDESRVMIIEIWYQNEDGSEELGETWRGVGGKFVKDEQ